MLKMKIEDTLKVLTPYKVRRKILNARFSSRKPTSPLRVLPDFLVIGAMRAGTSSLYKYMGSHPAVIPSLRKEIKYFSSEYNQKNESWYRCHFPTGLDIRLLTIVRGTRIQTFEASPDYLLHPRAAARAAKLVPEAKIIVMLRNPVDRAFSHYQHMFRLGLETLPFEEAIAQEPVRLEAEQTRIGEEQFYDSKTFLRASYFCRGCYADQLQVWLEQFPRENFLFVRSEDFFEQPQVVYQEILDFLDLPAWQLPAFRNYSYVGASKPKAQPQSNMGESFRRELAERYAPYNQHLFDLLGRNFAWE